ncbi:unnamed protein product [Psylliodes chrysocephalus]|uniref:Double jelly roll-like domain-containing protein n=1 Tax=Psylliodes chrysocephalus TaxID=3402493 RepID=A0A9P0D666_9CUCU|nr:unnamed protein product [Psylliodes chrysocephala]
MFQVTQEPINDVTIEENQFHLYQPNITGNINYNDEIRISIQDLDAYTLPSESYIYIEGKLLTDTGKVPTKFKFINNGVAYLFRELRYELNGVVIDSVRNVGLVSTIKNYLSFNKNESVSLENAGWFPNYNPKDAVQKILADAEGNFNVCIPLKLLSGFFEDFKKIIMNMKQELVLIRTSDDIDAIIGSDETEKPKIELTKILWNVPHIQPNLSYQLYLTNIANNNLELPIKFRSWQLIEYPSLNNSTRHTWAVKTSSNVETPRHVIIGFQKDRKGDITKDMSQFDHCNLNNIRLFLNSERYPYNDLHLNFESNRYAALYDMFTNFQETYYNNKSQPIFNPEQFKTKSPLIHIDCSRQKEVLQSGSVVLRIEFETDTPTPTDTSAYCLILHEKHFSYFPASKIVKQK